ITLVAWYPALLIAALTSLSLILLPLISVKVAFLFSRLTLIFSAFSVLFSSFVMASIHIPQVMPLTSTSTLPAQAVMVAKKTVKKIANFIIYLLGSVSNIYALL